ncbi:MAG: hypothetical protein HYY30_00420 [Chloroflexi bacterium]|nr:hypothetical protein [Chloroflexota bacterium]
MISIDHLDVAEAPGDCQIHYFDILRDRLDISAVPFSERGSRILVGTDRDGGLAVRMAERWPHLEKKLGGHRDRSPLIARIEPADDAGRALPFRLVTWPHLLRLETSVGSFEVFFGDRETLYICLPSRGCGLSCSIMAERFVADDLGGTFDTPRLLAITADSYVTSLRVGPRTEGHRSCFVDSPDGHATVLAIHIPESDSLSRSVEPGETVKRRAEKAWRTWFDAVPRVSEGYWREYYFAWMLLRNGLLSPKGYLKREAMAPSKTHYLGVWHWDAYFHALAYRHADVRLAQDQLRTLLDHQLDSGLIPDMVHDEGLIVCEDGPRCRELTKPPLMAWAALKIFESGGGSDFLREIYEPLVRWNNWWLERCDDDGDGVAQYNHPFSSGLDDSPLWDAGMPVESPDLNTYLCVHMQSLAAIARIIGRSGDIERWERSSRALARRTVAHFYDEASGIFWATKDHQPLRVLTPFNILPIWTGSLRPSQVRAAIANLGNPDIFWTEFGVPTVARTDSNYDPDTMWRGPTWVNVNYMLVEALTRAGYRGLATTLADRTIDLVMRRGAAEYFNSITGEVPAKAAPAFGWSAALFIDLLVRRARENRSGNNGNNGETILNSSSF